MNGTTSLPNRNLQKGVVVIVKEINKDKRENIHLPYMHCLFQPRFEKDQRFAAS